MSRDTASKIVVVHLVWGPAGVDALRAFTESYRAFEAGVAHDLIVLLKSVDRDREATYREMAGEAIVRRISASGLDVRSYADIADELLSYQYVTFLNSHSTIRGDAWLSKLLRHVSETGVGAVAATGSYESASSLAIDAAASESGGRSVAARRLGRLASVHLRGRARTLSRDIPLFPNPHLRTNAFMIGTSLWNSLETGPARTKAQTLRFESGRRGMTRQIQARGLQVLVVGRDGHGFDIPDWPHSDTYRTGQQSNLLIGDNRTDQFSNASVDFRHVLARAAWGAEADE